MINATDEIERNQIQPRRLLGTKRTHSSIDLSQGFPKFGPSRGIIDSCTSADRVLLPVE
jgi:hypothetical protein